MANPCNILVTRPSGQADSLMNSLQQAGFHCVHQPLIDIVPVENDPLLKQRMLNLDHYQTVISVSANASKIALDWIDEYWPQPPVDIQWLAVGPTSADELAPLMQTVKTPELAQTEGMLAMPELQADQVNGQKVLILRGQGGRETLAQTLAERGAEVHYAELYGRQPVAIEEGVLSDLCEQQHIDTAILTSGDLVKQFIDKLSNPELLASIRLVVPSQRVAQYAKDLGATHVVQSEGANSQSLLKCIQTLVDSDTFS